MKRRLSEREVSMLLTLGDPAAGEAELSEVEARRMKARMLTEPSRAHRLRPGLMPWLLAPAGALSLALAGLAWWSSLEPGAVPELAVMDFARPLVAANPPVDLLDEATSTPTRLAPASLPKPANVGRARRPRAQPITAEPAARQLEFETPGGTRVVWVLDPQLDLKTHQETTEETTR